MHAVVIHRLAGGQLVEHWSGKYDLSLLRQLGVASP
jgi:hypothetical protein